MLSSIMVLVRALSLVLVRAPFLVPVCALFLDSSFFILHRRLVPAPHSAGLDG